MLKLLFEMIGNTKEKGEARAARLEERSLQAEERVLKV